MDLSSRCFINYNIFLAWVYKGTFRSSHLRDTIHPLPVMLGHHCLFKAFLANNASPGPVCILVVRIHLHDGSAYFRESHAGVRERMNIAVAMLVLLVCLSELIVFWDQNFYMETQL